MFTVSKFFIAIGSVGSGRNSEIIELSTSRNASCLGWANHPFGSPGVGGLLGTKVELKNISRFSLGNGP